jgi:N-acylneuraminate cytidylyltransferase
MNYSKYITVILARAGSKGIKNKNIKILNKKPLIFWSIKHSLNSSKISQTYVSSDSKKILNISKKYGAKIILRPKKYSSSKSSSEEAWLHAIKYLKKNDINASHIIGLQPTSPLRGRKDIDKAITLFKNKNLDSLFSSVKIKDHFIWKKNKNKLIANYNYKKRRPRQKIQDQYLENGSIYIFIYI